MKVNERLLQNLPPGQKPPLSALWVLPLDRQLPLSLNTFHLLASVYYSMLAALGPGGAFGFMTCFQTGWMMIL
jgi:hypothetical protein